jgi:alpha-D-ribose 1-methylphosphonate 5-triphosphate synthase subunit PhnH
MSASVTLQPYDQVFDGQRHYRSLLQSTARPGTIGQLDDVLLEVPPQLNRATALLALTLFSSDSSFYLARGEEPAIDFLRRETLAKPAGAAQADFLLLPDTNRLEEIHLARLGSLAYPDLGATVVLQVTAISPAPMPGCLRLMLTGPGIETETTVFVMGAPEAFFAALQERNMEFPVGVDAYLTCDSLSAGPCVLALPRTTRVRWKQI